MPVAVIISVLIIILSVFILILFDVASLCHVGHLSIYLRFTDLIVCCAGSPYLDGSEVRNFLVLGKVSNNFLFIGFTISLSIIRGLYAIYLKNLVVKHASLLQVQCV